MKRYLATALACIALACITLAGGARASEPPAAAAAADGAARRLLNKHLMAFVQNDLDGVLSDYTSDSVLVAPEAIYRGPAQIRQFFAGLMREFPRGSSKLELDRTEFNGELVYFVWHAKTPTLDVPFATDTMIVRDGKIVQQTFAGMLQRVRH